MAKKLSAYHVRGKIFFTTEMRVKSVNFIKRKRAPNIIEHCLLRTFWDFRPEKLNLLRIYRAHIFYHFQHKTVTFMIMQGMSRANNNNTITLRQISEQLAVT